MNSEHLQWQKVKENYLKLIEKNLAQVDHPRRSDILANVREHLDNKYAELYPEQQNWEGYQQIITEMGPPEEYAELLSEDKTPETKRAFGINEFLAIVFVIVLIGVGGYLIHNTKNAPPPAPAPKAIEFELDEHVLGKWVTVDCVKTTEDFDPTKKNYPVEFHLKGLDFQDKGVVWQFIQDKKHKYHWTKGKISPLSERPAFYYLKKIDKIDYLFFEWISGDVTIRGREPGYYVFKRAASVESSQTDINQKPEQNHSHRHSEANIIVPGVRVGDYRFGMSKDEVLKILGETKRGSLRETNNSISVDGLILFFADDTVKRIDVMKPLYRFENGLGIGDSEQKIKQTFGEDFQLDETGGKDFLSYEDKGLVFEIHKKNRTVMEITVLKAKEIEVEDDKYNLMARRSKGPDEALDPNAANLIRRYLHALEQSSWKAALSMCSINVMDKAQQYPTPEFFFNTVVPVKEILNKLRDPRTGSWQGPPKYFTYFFDVRISQPDLPRDVFWVWKARKLEGRTNWEIDFPAILFKTWLANEKREIIQAVQEHEQRIKKMAPRFKGVRTLLTAKREEFVVGNPIYFRLQLINQGDSILSYDCQQVAVNNSMTIEGPDGKEVKYTAESLQTYDGPVLIKPGETKTLFDQLDITEQYDIRQPGQYRVQFNGHGLMIGIAKEDPPELNDISKSFEYYPGSLPSNVVVITIHSGIKQETLDVGKD